MILNCLNILILQKSEYFLKFSKMSLNFIYKPPISERDLKFFQEMKDSIKLGYVPLKRIILEEEGITEEQRQKWILADRQHFAKWRLRKIKRDREIKEKQKIREEKRNAEYVSYLLNIEYETLYENFWREAPLMRPYQRGEWFKYRWPEYYWKHTKYTTEIINLGEESGLLWFDVPTRGIVQKSKL